MNHPSRRCRQCNNEFTPFRKNQEFCTVDCRDAWWEWHWKHEDHKCPSCGRLHSPGATYEAIKRAVDEFVEEQIARKPQL